MNSEKMTRAEMIRWLGDAISTETSKPFDEIDYDFVDECGSLLDELMGKSTVISEEEAAEKLAKLKPEVNVGNKKVKVRNIWKVLIAAACVVMCLSITVLAVPKFRAIFMNVLRFDTGDSVMENGITYIYNGKGKIYTDINSLINTESLDILSFDDPDGKLKITTVYYIEDTSTTVIDFNDPSISFEIYDDVNYIDDAIINNSKEFRTDYFTAYIFETEIPDKSFYNSYIYYNNDTYLIKCSSEHTLLSVLNSLIKGDMK